jgi:predicted Ser/Thr protein kinase
VAEACLEPEVIEKLLDGSLDPSSLERAEAHIDGCSECRVVLSELARLSSKPDAADLGTSPTVATSLGTLLPAAAALDDITTIGRYHIERRLGSGGMGVVLLAEDPELKRKVVIKLLRSEIAESATTRERLQREAQAMARVSHPNVVPIYDVGVHRDRVFLAMEYIDGCDLAKWLSVPRSADDILRVFLAAGRGLAAAHAAGLVHRDFKPHNVMIANTGEVKVTDFGLARAELAERSLGDTQPARPIARARPSVTPSGGLRLATLLESPLTQTGALVGTPAYMAPEQILGDAVDARTDQFSFCIALYEAIEGKRPFRGNSAAEQFDATLSGEAPPMKQPPSARVERVLRRGLALEPANRFASMDELLRELMPPPRRTPIIAGAIGVAAIAAVVVAIVVVRSRKASTDISAVTSAWSKARGCIAGSPQEAHSLDTAIAARDVMTGDDELCDTAIIAMRDTLVADDASDSARRAVRDLAAAYATHRRWLANADSRTKDQLADAVTDVDDAVRALEPAWRPPEPARRALPEIAPKPLDVDGLPVTLAPSGRGHMHVQTASGEKGILDWASGKPELRSASQVWSPDRSWFADEVVSEGLGFGAAVVVDGKVIGRGEPRSIQIFAALGDHEKRVVVFIADGLQLSRSTDGGRTWSTEQLLRDVRSVKFGTGSSKSDRLGLLWSDDGIRWLEITAAAVAGAPAPVHVTSAKLIAACSSWPAWFIADDGGDEGLWLVGKGRIARFRDRATVVGCGFERAIVDVRGEQHACDPKGCHVLPSAPAGLFGVVGTTVFRVTYHPHARILGIWRDGAKPAAYTVPGDWTFRGTIEGTGTPMLSLTDSQQEIGLAPLP